MGAGDLRPWARLGLCGSAGMGRTGEVKTILGNWDAPLRENLFIFSSALPGVGRVSGTFQ